MSHPALDRIASGAWYDCMAPDLCELRDEARRAVHRHNTMEPDVRGACAPDLAALFARMGEGAFVEAPFHVAYGRNLALGDGVYINAGCAILDTGPVALGDRTMLGPGGHIHCADHHRGLAERRAGLERALPVTVGSDGWIGGGAILLPGVTVGAGAIIGAGSVVTRDVAPMARVAGNPARPL